MRTRWIETATHDGPTIAQDGYTATLQNWSLSAAWPGGGWVWNRPKAVLVNRMGVQERIPIRNITQLVQIALCILAAAGAISLFIQPATRSQHRRNRNG